jgi:hypothetical protein
MERRNFLKSLFGLSASAAIPAYAKPFIDALEPIVAMPGEASQQLWFVFWHPSVGKKRIPVRVDTSSNGQIVIPLPPMPPGIVEWQLETDQMICWGTGEELGGHQISVGVASA